MKTELSPTERKLAREVIEIGLQREFEKGLKNFDRVLNDWKEKKKDNRDSYLILYKSLSNFDKHIARRYDNVSGTRYLGVIAEQLKDGTLTQDDLKGFGAGTLAAIGSYNNSIKRPKSEDRS